MGMAGGGTHTNVYFLLCPKPLRYTQYLTKSSQIPIGQYYNPHFTGEDTRLREVKPLASDHTAAMYRAWI